MLLLSLAWAMLEIILMSSPPTVNNPNEAIKIVEQILC